MFEYLVADFVAIFCILLQLAQIRRTLLLIFVLVLDSVLLWFGLPPRVFVQLFLLGFHGRLLDVIDVDDHDIAISLGFRLFTFAL